MWSTNRVRGLLSLAACALIVVVFVLVNTALRESDPSAPSIVPSGSPTMRADPSSWPDASNTGVPAGTTLTPSGSVTVAVAGAVVSGLDVSGCLVIEADNVTIEDTRIRHGTCSDRFNIDTGTGQYTGILIEDVEIDGQNEDTGQDDGIGFAGFTCLRCNIHGVGEGANVTDDVTFEDSWIHDLHYAEGEHIEDVVSNGGSSLELLHNTFDAGATPGTSSAVSLYGDFGPITNVVIKGNMFNTGGSYCLYAGGSPGKKYPIAKNVSVIGNDFGTKYYPRCGIYGPQTGFAVEGGNTWSGNTLAGAALSP
jgi:hypothetical protein